MCFDILFLGKLFPKEIETAVKNKMRTGMQDAANALQWNIINGIDENNHGKIKIISQLPVDSYPRGYTEYRIKRYTFQHSRTYRSDDVIIGHTNVRVLKQFATYSPLKKEVVSWAKSRSEHKKVIILYTASLDFLRIAKLIKKRYKNIQVCCIIADLPEYSCAHALHGIHKAYNKWIVKRSMPLYKFIDKYVLLTEQMAKKLQIKVPYIIMEGIAPRQEISLDQSIVQRIGGYKYILYTGTLNYEFGIGVLLKAFSLIRDEEIKLVICGVEAAAKEILGSTDSRIVFLGRVDRKQSLSLQEHATILVNPRQNNEEFTKYSFPSKTMEYLASGIPVVAYKLDGIPEEYDEHIIYVPDDTPNSLAETITNVLNMDDKERNKIGDLNKHFILTEKNYLVQSRRILTLLEQ